MAERDAARQTHRELTRADAEVDEAYDSIRTLLLNRAARLAPGPAAARWDEPEWRSADWLATGAARQLRVGSLVISGVAAEGEQLEDLPALVPLLDVGNLAVVDGEGASWPTDVLSGLVLRALATAPAGRLEVVVYDPRIRGVFSPFSGLRRASADIFGEPVATAAEFADRLHRLRAAVARVAELVGAHSVADLGELVAATGVQPEPYRLVVVLDYPTGIDSAVQAELVRIADGGPRRGVSLLVHHDPRAKGGNDVNPAVLLEHMTVVTGRPGALEVSTLPGVTVRPDPAPPRDLVASVAAHLADRAHHGAAPSVDFADLLPPPEQVWSRDAIQGMTAVLGTSGFDRVELDLRGSDPALPNALIGGASGQGKSNLLLVLLHSIAAAYPPEEVEMYLLDFKDGLEFDRLGPAPRPSTLDAARPGARPGGRSAVRAGRAPAPERRVQPPRRTVPDLRPEPPRGVPAGPSRGPSPPRAAGHRRVPGPDRESRTTSRTRRSGSSRRWRGGAGPSASTWCWRPRRCRASRAWPPRSSPSSASSPGGSASRPRRRSRRPCSGGATPRPLSCASVARRS